MAELRRLLNTKEAANYLGVAEQTLRNWKFNRTKPIDYVKIGSRVLYEIPALEKFIEANRVTVSS